MMWWVRHEWSGWAWVVMSVSMVAVWVFVVWVVAAILRRLRNHDVRSSDAWVILDERDGCGEVDDDEARAHLDMLASSPTDPTR